jgi:hypothetical protein
VTTGAEPLPTPDLWKQYEIVLQEYRFQVQLNWDRAKHFLIFNTAIFAAAVALYKNGSTSLARLGVASLMLISAANSLVGWQTVSQGHEIYRDVRDLKARRRDAPRFGRFRHPVHYWHEEGPRPRHGGNPE